MYPHPGQQLKEDILGVALFSVVLIFGENIYL
jgi:hypothetical protein